MTENKFVIIITIKKIELLIVFLAVRKQTSTDAIIFSIVNLIEKSNKYNDSYFKIGDKLKEFNNVTIQPRLRIREPTKDDTDRKTTTNKQLQQQQQNNRQRQVSKKSRFLSG